MNQAPAAVPENTPTLERVCEDVKGLYRGIQKIQYEQKPDGRVYLSIIYEGDVDPDLISDIQQVLLLSMSHIPGVKCSIRDIRIQASEDEARSAGIVCAGVSSAVSDKLRGGDTETRESTRSRHSLVPALEALLERLGWK